MSQSILQPKSLDEWLLVLERTPIPAHKGQKEKIWRLMANQETSIGEISRAISQAPSIALLLFRAANRNLGHLSEPAYTLEAVIKRLGMAQCMHLLAGIRDESQLRIPVALRQVWLMGQHANHHANALFSHKMARLWSEIHWGSLLFFAPVWPLLLRHPEILKIWEQRVLGNQEAAHKVEQELLGTSLVQLCHALAKRWCLPQWITDGYAILASNHRIIARALHLARMHDQPLEQQRRLDQQRDLNHWISQPAISIVLSSGLAVSSHNTWSNEHTLRWQRLISLYLRQSLDEVQQKIHQTSAEHARYLGTTELWHPAQALLWPWSSRRFLAEPKPATSRQPVVEKLQEASRKPEHFDLPRWKEQARQLLTPATPFRNTLQMLNHYVHMFQYGGMSRVLVLSISQESGQLAPLCQLGFDFSLQQCISDRITNPVFRHILKNKDSLHVQEQNYSQVADHLDRSFLDAINSCNLLLGSIWHKDQPVLIVLADAWGHPLHPESLKAFNASNRYLEQALSTWKS